MKIKEKRLNWENHIDGFEYLIKGNNHIGDAQLIYAKIQERIGTDIFDVLIQEGLDENNIFVHLNEFYPNGRGLNEETNENMRKGFGTKVLNYLTKKAISKGAKAMFVFSGKTSMQYFLIKHGFKEISNYRFIKMI